MRKRRKGRIYVKDLTNGRLYGDFRDLNGKCEALKQDGRATTDWDVAGILVAKRVKELEDEKRGQNHFAIAELAFSLLLTHASHSA